MTSLCSTTNWQDADRFYVELVAAIENVDEAEAIAMLTRLVVVLANHIGDREVLSEAVALAVRGTHDR